jgi:hypothetical protein
MTGCVLKGHLTQDVTDLPYANDPYHRADSS